MIKILYLYGYPFFNLASAEGPAVHINSTLQAFCDAGCEMTVYAGSTKKLLARRSNSAALPPLVKYLRKTLIDLAELAHNLMLYVRISRQASKPNLIYERYSLFSWAGLALRWKWRLPLFVEFNDPGIETRQKYFGRSLLEPVSLSLFRRIAAQAEAIIAISRPVAVRLVEKGVPEQKIHIIPNGVAPEVFHANGCDLDEIRRQYGLQDALVIGFVGGMQPWHGVKYLVQAAPAILAAQPNLKFLMVGGEPDAVMEIQRLARVGGVGEHFVCTGWVRHEQIPAHLAVMDIVTAPYAPLKQNAIYFSPLKVFEYMAMGKPVIASRMEQLSALFADGVEIVLIEPGNIQELASAVLALAADPAYRQALGTQARRKVLTEHTWEKTVQKILAIYGHTASPDSHKITHT